MKRGGELHAHETQGCIFADVLWAQLNFGLGSGSVSCRSRRSAWAPARPLRTISNPEYGSPGLKPIKRSSRVFAKLWPTGDRVGHHPSKEHGASKLEDSRDEDGLEGARAEVWGQHTRGSRFCIAACANCAGWSVKRPGDKDEGRREAGGSGKRGKQARKGRPVEGGEA